jgi:uncharacterized protein involved in exopolysaccharide biosynthesis
MSIDEEQFEEQEQPRGMPPGELVKSYAAFFKRAVRYRRLLCASVFLLVSAGAILISIVLPRAYHCESRLMVQGTGPLDSRREDVGRLEGARNAITRRENLQQIVKEADLVRDWDLSRPVLLKTKDRLMEMVSGPVSEEAKLNRLADMVDNRLNAEVKDSALTVGVDWPNGQAAARIVDAAQQIFIQSRHAVEVAIVQEKISILDEHAKKLGEEINQLAEQIQRAREDQIAQLTKTAKEANADPAPAAAPAQPRRVARAAEPDEQLPILKDELEAKKKELGELEAERDHRLRDAESRLAELKLHFTNNHPQVNTQEQVVESLSHEAPRVTGLKADVQELETEIKQRQAAARGEVVAVGGGGPSPSGSRGAPPEALPPNVLKALESGVGVDPTIQTQLSSAVFKYGSLREAVRNSLIELDTAQAAFNLRYKVIAPPVAPSAPFKPKVPQIIGGGIFLALLLAIIIPVLLELRTGLIVERWQLQQLDLPVLAELHLPPGTRE